MTAGIGDLIECVKERLNVLNRSLLADFAPDGYLRQVNGIRTYNRIPPDVKATCQKIMGQVGGEGLEDYHRLILLMLIRDFDNRPKKQRYPEPVRELLAEQFRRIADHIAKGRSGPYLFSSDSFCKDLGICTQRLIPAGGLLLDPSSGVPRSWLLQGGLGQRVRLAKIWRRMGGSRPLYQMHNDQRQWKRFDPAGWEAAYGIIALLLEWNPEIRGTMGSTWWLDPEVARITPKLGYLRELPEAGGAEFFDLGEDEATTKDAITYSPERWQCYSEGSYRPKRIGMVWDRERLIAEASLRHWI